MSKYFRVVVYLKDDGHYSIPIKEDFIGCMEEYFDKDYVIREFKLTNEHKFNRAKDNEVK